MSSAPKNDGAPGGAGNGTNEDLPSEIYPKAEDTFKSDNKKFVAGLYEQSSLVASHYSSRLINFRMLAITQGLVVLGVAAYLAGERNLFQSLFVCIFGMPFAAVVWFMMKNYELHMKAVVGWTTNLEHLMADCKDEGDDGKNAIPLTVGPWHTYKTHRNRRYAKWQWRWLVTRGPILLFAAAVLLILFWDIVGLCYGWQKEFPWGSKP